jgi:hypothetical protein
MTAAPEAIAKQATFVRVDDNFEQTAVLQKGSNGFTCGIEPDTGIPFCADVGAMAWYKAIYTKADPPDRTGFVYMMTGDTGTSNHDPYATTKATGWRPGRMSCSLGKPHENWRQLIHGLWTLIRLNPTSCTPAPNTNT